MKAKIREWLGLDVLPTYQHFNAITANIQRGQEELLARMERLETLVSRPQVTRSVSISSISDWETVQLLKMQELERNPEKEN